MKPLPWWPKRPPRWATPEVVARQRVLALKALALQPQAAPTADNDDGLPMDALGRRLRQLESRVESELSAGADELR